MVVEHLVAASQPVPRTRIDRARGARDSPSRKGGTGMAYIVSCHCGRLRLEVDAALGEVFECNCSICTRTGFLHWYV